MYNGCMACSNYITLISWLTRFPELRLSRNWKEKGFSFLACAGAVTFLFVYRIIYEKQFDETSVCIGQHLFYSGIARTLKDCQADWKSSVSFAPYHHSCEQLIDLGHQTLKACLITMIDRLGTNIVCLEKLPSFSKNLDKEIGPFKPLKGVIKTVLLELEEFFDSSWNRPIKENSIAELLLIIMKNLVVVQISCAITLPSYKQD